MAAPRGSEQPCKSAAFAAVAAINEAIPSSPAAMSKLVTQLEPVLQATANDISARVI